MLLKNRFTFSEHQLTSVTKYLATLVLCLLCSACASAQHQPWKQMIGKKAPPWSDLAWVNADPVSLADLAGKVVLIRWWLESCPYCEATAPSLNAFQSKYAEKGLVIIGLYHPKPYGRKVSVREVREYCRDKGFRFPVAIDEDWQTLSKYWFEKGGRDFTSVSFIIDRDGIIRYIHPGGSYNPEGLPFRDPQWRKDYFEVEKVLEELLN